MAAAAQAESLLPWVKLPVPEASIKPFKGLMDEKNILNYIHQYKLYFSLVPMSNKYIQALFPARLL